MFVRRRLKKRNGLEFSECKQTHTHTHVSNIRWSSLEKLSFNINKFVLRSTCLTIQISEFTIGHLAEQMMHDYVSNVHTRRIRIVLHRVAIMMPSI